MTVYVVFGVSAGNATLEYEGVPVEGKGVASGLGSGEGAGTGVAPAMMLPDDVVTVMVVCPGPMTPETISSDVLVNTPVLPLIGNASLTAGTAIVLQTVPPVVVPLPLQPTVRNAIPANPRTIDNGLTDPIVSIHPSKR